MNDMQSGRNLPELREHFFKAVSENNYSDYYQYYFEIRFNALEQFMKEQRIRKYTPDVGSNFIEDFLSSRSSSRGTGTERGLRCFIAKVNDVYSGIDFLSRHNSKEKAEPVGFQDSLSDYSSFCLENGNKSSTIALKYNQCRIFCLTLNAHGCNSLDHLSETVIIQSCLAIKNHDAWRFIREFLEYLYSTSQCNKDFSYLVPKAEKKTPLPSVYTNEETKQMEDAIDISTPSGKRDICIMLLESRLAMRSGDIVKLTFQEVDFNNDRISYIQEKTGQPMSFPMLPEIKTALQNYLDYARPDSKDEHIFLRVNAPFLPLTTAALRNISKKYIQKANIDTAGRRKGPHTRRSFVASSMVNDGISYDVVKTILGHKDPNAIKHYAALDKENLRQCALPVPSPTGKLKDIFEGRCSL